MKNIANKSIVHNIRPNFSIALFLALSLGVLISACQRTKFSEDEMVNYNDLDLPKKPNILWLVTEDMGPFIPPFGDSTIRTPNLSRLASEGVVFPHVYSPSGVCAPSRTAVITGMYPSSIGANHMRTNSHTEITGLPPYEAVPPPQVRLMSEWLRINDYYCTNNVKEDYQFSTPVTAWDESSELAHWRNRNQNQPFFSVFNFMVTHESGLFEPYPIRAGEFRHYHAGDTALVLTDSAKIALQTRAQMHVSKQSDFPIPPYLPDNEIVRNDLWKMYNNIAEMDAQLGAILDQLEADGLLENTIIFFFADHGGPLPRQKRMVYDAGLNAPMIIRFPNQQLAGKIDEQLISFVDFAPTVLSLSSSELPDYFQGRPFLGKDASLSDREYIHAAADRFDGYTDVIRAVRDHRFKYIRNYRPQQGYYLPIAYRERIPTMQELLRLEKEGQLNAEQAQWFRQTKPEEELFDCKLDPHELVNLASDPAYENKRSELSAEMDRWLISINDDPNLPESELINKLWQGESGKPKTDEPKMTLKNKRVTLSCTTPGASLGYRFIDEKFGRTGSTWEVYTEPVIVPTAATLLEVKSHRIGFDPSEIIAFDLDIQH
ncbi:MAG: sulfatase [Reichenbachiella sp.]|uniref:sulfatase family protein n=1 Tax=Reichenbachiella sp. TaxID=2184521 RepID=UPI003264165A